MPSCQFAPVMHDTEATHSVIFSRSCCKRWIESVLVCDEHALKLEEEPRAARETTCKWCGNVNSVTATVIVPMVEAN